VVQEESLCNETKYASIGFDSRADENDSQASGKSELKEEQISIEFAKHCFDEFDYQKGCEICLKLLKRDYNNDEAHQLILDTFHALGFKNEFVISLKAQLKEIMLNNK
jgi:SOS response regulatory protein OraA/RecX